MPIRSFDHLDQPSAFLVYKHMRGNRSHNDHKLPITFCIINTNLMSYGIGLSLKKCYFSYTKPKVYYLKPVC